jgi:1-aminocyclopropane-1-carboxylate deaminase
MPPPTSPPGTGDNERVLPPTPPPSPLTALDDDRLAARGVRLLLKRDDLLAPEVPEVSGNKWRKLRHNLAAARAGGHRTLLTFGGAWSNHLRATAAAGRLHGLATVGVVRGDELAARPLNPVLTACAADGMRLVFLDRATYRRKAEPGVLAALLTAHGPAYVLPEGGSNAAAVRGCAELGAELRDARDTEGRPVRVDVAAVACGTGGTLAGLAAGLDPDRQRALGFPVLRGGFLAAEVERLQREAYGARRGAWSLATGSEHGGYARTTPELTAFVADFAARHGFAPDPVYVAKMLHGVVTLATTGALAPGTTVAAVVTGPGTPCG